MPPTTLSWSQPLYPGGKLSTSKNYLTSQKDLSQRQAKLEGFLLVFVLNKINDPRLGKDFFVMWHQYGINTSTQTKNNKQDVFIVKKAKSTTHTERLQKLRTGMQTQTPGACDAVTGTLKQHVREG